MTQIAIVIPAAGASRRMGARDKLLEPVDGRPLLRGVAQRALAVSEHVFVTLPDPASQRRDALQGLDVSLVMVPDAKDGMSASLRRAAAEVPEGVDGVMILPADMPDLTVEDLQLVAQAFGDSSGAFLVQGAGRDEKPGHPVIFPADLIPALQTLEGDNGARAVLKANASRLIRVALPGDNALIDLDTPDAWTLWRANNPGR
ncbi:nucleotidyltransferase family protein [Marivita sp. XM-24bin2]|jgi:CTP:molybdopterin cytidylyltransferase MocA|uniref:nucleotidyltransferase family protein n=1 Tax=unclassified Marivita TaxID=2632480 RepID=UPI000D79B60F|nr:nucleotidyltransferase family protein [Marivita sp. XM-24bin2]MCR9109305.1 nucleotidyltransferase family protein [Paracoccaceae bacterium]PWL34486.1 MAG: nucleotidyltransferase family protein [Marivita sp. XM-24bin2]